MSQRATTDSHSQPTLVATEARASLAERADALYREHHGMVFHLALRYGLGNEAWAEDLAQDVFLTMLDELPRLADPEQLAPWLYRVTTRRCLRRLQRDRFLRQPVVEWFLRLSAPSGPDLEGQVFARHALERARLRLAEMPPKERVVVSMCALDGRSQKEACEVLGLSKGYVSKLMARGLARLGAHDDAQGGEHV